jgi:RND family efflux transporter MFP subunit
MGTVRAAERATIASRIPGQIAKADIEIGQTVKAGEMLLQLDAAEWDARVAQAESALAQVRRDLARESKLLSQNATTSETVRTLEDAARAAEAQLAEARTLRSYTQIAAPFDGVVVEKWITFGDQANPGEPLLRLEGPQELEISLRVPASLALPAAGSALTVLAGETVLQGTLTALTPSLDPQTRTREALLRLPADTPVPVGSFVRVEWPAKTSAVLHAPFDAIREYGQLQQVFVLNDQTVSMRLIRIGRHFGDAVEIQSGLQVGESVVLNPPSALREGDRVEVLP